MISVGIDVSKGKSTVCMLKASGETISKPFEIMHIERELNELCNMILRFDDEVKVLMEATGVYHLPILTYLQERDIFVSVINPYLMKLYRSENLRKVKTDKIDSKIIASYGIEHWFTMEEFNPAEDIYAELKLLGQQYRHYMKLHVASLMELTHIIEYTMPGIKKHLSSWNEGSRKDKLSDFVEQFWHFDNIKKLGMTEFMEEYNEWAKERGYQQTQSKAQEIYELACQSIPTIASDTPSIKMLVREAVRVLKEIDNTLGIILSQMQKIARELPEYSVVREMNGVGNVLAPKLIAEIGDIRRFHNGKALIAYAGIDAPPYESGQFTGSNRHISKRGSASLRKVGYETMRCIKTHAKEDDSVYQYILKKESEGKAKKSAKIAGLNKFLRIYYARVKEVYENK